MFCGYCGNSLDVRNLHNISKNSGLITATAIIFIFIGILIALTSASDCFYYFINAFDEVFEFFAELYNGALDLYYLQFSLIYFLSFLQLVMIIVGLIMAAVLLLKKDFLNKLLNYSILCVGMSYIADAFIYFLYIEIELFVLVLLQTVIGIAWIVNIYPNIKLNDKIRENKKLISIVVSAIAIFIYLYNYIQTDSKYYSYYLVMAIALILFSLCADSFVNTPQNNNMYDGRIKKERMNEMYENDNYTRANNVALEPEGYIKVWVLIILSIVTFGIYYFIWIYKTSRLLNRKLPQSQPDNETTQLLLCIFIPFYMIYWIYKTCKRIEEYNYRLGIGGNDLSIMGLLFSIFGLLIVAVALMQDQINKNLLFEEGRYTPHSYQSSTSNMNNKGCFDGNMNSAKAGREDEIRLLRELKSLLDEGIINEEEFNFKKHQILNK